MKNVSLKKSIPLAAIVLLFGLFFIYKMRNTGQGKISEFGHYNGYSEEAYDGSQRTSDYLTLSDGTRLAYDVIVPTKKGVPAVKPLPTLFKYTPYGRTWTVFDKNGKFILGELTKLDWPTEAYLRIRYLLDRDNGRLLDPLLRDRWLGDMVKHGYIIVSVDRPGTGASFTSPTPGSMETASKFENEIINWIAAQPWSDGKVGMYGDSAQAVVQFAAAAAGNPHLKAILPAASWMEIYQAVEYPGGVFNTDFSTLYEKSASILSKLATPVDSDPDGIVMRQAIEGRSADRVIELGRQCPLRDGTSPTGINPWKVSDLSPFIERINHSGTAIDMTVGWYDIFTADMFNWYNNLSVPKRLIVRPTDHSQVSSNLTDLNYGNEALRWFDYWLKGIDNGIMNEAPIHYYLQEGAKKGTWQTSDQWPLATQAITHFYFDQGKSGSSASANDGILTTDSPSVSNASDGYTVDYTATTGTKTRWGAVDEKHEYPDMQTHDAKSLTYTTLPLKTDVEVTGSPVVHLWLSTTAPDLDAFVYLEVIDASGHSTYITEGDLRASHRKPSQASYNVMSLPFQSHNQSDLEPIPSGEPFEMIFSLLPTSFEFGAGSRIRITVAFADAGNFNTAILDPAPKLELLRESSAMSFVELPINQ